MDVQVRILFWARKPHRNTGGAFFMLQIHAAALRHKSLTNTAGQNEAIRLPGWPSSALPGKHTIQFENHCHHCWKKPIFVELRRDMPFPLTPLLAYKRTQAN